jgi:hypothetical protein
MSRIRATEWGAEEYWVNRITGYLDGTHNPQKALPQRVIYVAIQEESVVGFIAGHLTERFHCDGELEWINVVPLIEAAEPPPGCFIFWPPGSSIENPRASASTARPTICPPSASTRGTAQPQ